MCTLLLIGAIPWLISDYPTTATDCSANAALILIIIIIINKFV